MKIDLDKYRLTDELPVLMRAAYYDSANVNDEPCSICSQHPEQNGKRMHFHGSDFGICPRKLYHKITTERGRFEGSKFLKDGHLHERDIIESINFDKSFKLWHNANETELIQDVPFFDIVKNPGLNVKESILKFIETPVASRVVDNRRHFKITAHVDAVGVYTDPEDGTEIDFGIECKSVKDASWDTLKKGDVYDWWYGQMQCYMFITGIRRWYLLVKHRATSEILPPMRIDYDVKYIVKRLTHFNQVYLFANYGREVPTPSTHKSTDYECKYCDFRDKCWTSNDLKEGK